MESLIHDLRFSLRLLRRHPGFTATAVVTLALGLGANVAIFSAIHSVLLRPLPYRDEGSVVYLFNRSNAVEVRGMSVSPRDVVDYREQASLFEGIGAARASMVDAVLTGLEEPIPIRLQFATNNLFSLLGFEPVVGRGFLPEDASRPGSQEETDSIPETLPGAMLSHGLWQRHFGGDPGVLGRTIEVGGEGARIVGVLPERFGLVHGSERAGEAKADLWFPFFFDFREAQRGAPGGLWPIGRLKPGVTLEQAQAELDVIAGRLQEQVPEYRNQNLRLVAYRPKDEAVKSIRPALLMLVGAVGFLLLLSCANVANLFLVRARMRLSELSVRGALGCGSRRLARQILIECLVLAGAGGLAGLALAGLGIRFLMSLAPADLPRLDAVSINGPVLAFCLGASLVAAVLFGALPAIQAGRTDLAQGLKDQSRGPVGGRKSRLLGSLVVVEVALSLALLMGAGLMIRTFAALQEVRPGFEPDGALTFALDLYGERYYGSGPQPRIAFLQELEERLRALPGVEAVGSTNWAPYFFGGAAQATPYAWDEDSEARWPAVWANRFVISGDYLGAMQTRLLRGRYFTEQELTAPSPSVIVDEVLAREVWPEEDPIGKSLTALQPGHRVEVVGVVEHARYQFLREEGRNGIYFPYGAIPWGPRKFIVRGAGDIGSLVTPIRREIRALDPGLAIHHVASLEDVVDEELADDRLVLVLMGVFAGLALVLASVGLYGVISYSTRQRTAEIGIRMALGADRARILRLVLGRGGALIAIGAALGVAAALALSRFMGSLMYGVSATDPATIIVAALVLSAVGLLASYVPGRRAAKVDPAAALRAE